MKTMMSLPSDPMTIDEIAEQIGEMVKAVATNRVRLELGQAHQAYQLKPGDTLGIKYSIMIRERWELTDDGRYRLVAKEVPEKEMPDAPAESI